MQHNPIRVLRAHNNFFLYFFQYLLFNSTQAFVTVHKCKDGMLQKSFSFQPVLNLLIYNREQINVGSGTGACAVYAYCILDGQSLNDYHICICILYSVYIYMNFRRYVYCCSFYIEEQLIMHRIKYPQYLLIHFPQNFC